MNKKEFIEFMTKQMEKLSDERKIEFLLRVQNNYIPTIIHQIQKRNGYWVEPKDEKNYTLCNKCKRYSLTKKCKTESKREIRIESTYRDAGYGDDDRDGEVEYIVMYSICPLCGHKQEQNKFYVRKLREWNRREGIK